jgi:transcriptional regulator with XRE-family HTH domain
MTESQAQALGKLLQAAREKQGLSFRELAERSGVALASLAHIESGASREPLPSRVARLAEVLNVDPAEIDRVSGDHLARSLPSVRTYFRSKGQASKAEVDEIERVVAEIHAKYGTPSEDDRHAADGSSGGRS